MFVACEPMGGAKGPTDFATLDKDSDAQVTRSEFAQWGAEQGVLDMFQGEREGIVDETSLASALYTLWNREGDGLTENEWNDGLKAWFPEASKQTFTDWDINQDLSIDEQELAAGFAHGNMLQDWDANGDDEVTTDEAVTGIYQVFDTNRDDSVSRTEWTDAIGRWSWNL
ncbi:MAG: hypothetical protein Q8P41_04095 [Pseudomonadota bacterium]|nr:hypothetical protein [Pseudomonadota bacterium]